MSDRRHYVLLIPGFFGFEAIGELRYFVGVRDALEEAYSRRGHDLVGVHEVQTLPTASLRDRAGRVLDALASCVGEADAIHVVGHSTGGLDARLAIAPSANLPSSADSEEVLRTIQSVVTVSSPHGGSPLATFFASSAGLPLLRLLTSLGVVLLSRGALPVKALVKVGDFVRRLDDYAGLEHTVLDQLYRDLLAELDEERRNKIIELLREVGDDNALLFQLTPEGVDLLDAATGDPPDTRYGCVVTRSPTPSLSGVKAQKHDVYAQTLHAVYTVLALIARRGEVDTTVTDGQRRELERQLGGIDATAHDGIVPSLAQVWGTVVRAVDADHLDVTGHYGGRYGADWLPTDTDFDDDGFAQMWDDVAAFQLG